MAPLMASCCLLVIDKAFSDQITKGERPFEFEVENDNGRSAHNSSSFARGWGGNGRSAHSSSSLARRWGGNGRSAQSSSSLVRRWGGNGRSAHVHQV